MLMLFESHVAAGYFFFLLDCFPCYFLSFLKRKQEANGKQATVYRIREF